MAQKIGLAAILDMTGFNKGKAEYSQGIADMEGQTSSFGDKLKGVGSSILGFGGTVAKVAAGALAAGAAATAGLAVGIGKLATEAAPLEGIGIAFEAMAGKVGLSVEDLREAAKGTVSDFELMRMANVALVGAGEQLGQEFGDKLPGLLEIARAAALATGQDVGFLFNSLVTGIKRTSPMLIDNTGLQLKLGEANAKLAEELGKSVDELTAEERQIALLNATMEAGQVMVNQFGSDQLTAAERIAQFRAQMQNLKDQIGLAFIPAFQALLGPISDLAQEYGPQIIAWAQQAGEWLGENLPLAIEYLADLWQNTLKPALEAVGEVMITKVIPAIADVVMWLGEKLPPVISAVAGFWTNTLQPALQTVWTFLSEKVIPALSKVWDWLATNIPAAIKTVSDFWTNTLKPALEAVWSFITTSLIPAFSEAYDWLQSQWPSAIGEATTAIGPLVTATKTLGDSVKTNVIDRMAEVVSTIGGTVIPSLAELTNAIGEVISKAIDPFSRAVVDPMIKQLKSLGQIIATDVVARFQTVKDFLADIIPKAIGTLLGTAWVNLLAALEGVGGLIAKVNDWLGKVASAFGTIAGTIQWVIDLVKELILLLGQMQVPSWWPGGGGGGSSQWATPGFAGAPMTTGPMTTQTITVNMGGVNISNGMEYEAFAAQVQRVVRQAVQGY